MKTPSRIFTIAAGKGSVILGIARGSTLSISLSGDGKAYSAPIERVHKAMASWYQKANPTGKKRRRFITQNYANDADSES